MGNAPTTSEDGSGQRLRAARFLMAGDALARAAASGGKVLLQGRARGAISIRADLLRAMLRDGLVALRDSRVELTEEGRAFADRATTGDNAFARQHRDMTPKTVSGPDGPETVQANANESPLAQLARRRTKRGGAFLSQQEFRAGERLRADYTRGRIMPRLGANWEAAVASGKRTGGAGGTVELTEAALAARQRVEQALAVVGPELAGVLVDVCCFLKGLKQVESERGWPVRSAKVVLKTALAALGRHYEPEGGGAPSRRGVILHWGTQDFRPRMNER